MGDLDCCGAASLAPHARRPVARCPVAGGGVPVGRCTVRAAASCLARGRAAAHCHSLQAGVAAGGLSPEGSRTWGGVEGPAGTYKKGATPEAAAHCHSLWDAAVGSRWVRSPVVILWRRAARCSRRRGAPMWRNALVLPPQPVTPACCSGCLLGSNRASTSCVAQFSSSRSRSWRPPRPPAFGAGTSSVCAGSLYTALG